MNALIFGGNGFIGSHLANKLLSSGYFVRIFDRESKKHCMLNKNVDYHKAEFGDSIAIADALQSIDVVYHLISSTVPATSNLDPVFDIESNLINTVRLLEQMVQVGVKRIVFISSGGVVYGDTNTVPIPEDHPLHPICSYGVIKLAIEKYLFIYQKLYGISPIILRPSNAYGPQEAHIGVQGLISTVLKKLRNNEQIEIWGDGSIVRDYIYVDDLVRLCILAGQSEVTDIFNAGSGRGYSINEVFQIISDTIDIQPKVIFGEGRSFDVNKVILDISKAKKTFGWKPEISLQEGIQKLWVSGQGLGGFLK